MSDWKETNLGDICTEISYGFTASAVSEEVGPKFLRITDIVPSRIDWNSVPYCYADEATLQKYKLECGDIVIARTGATTGYNKIMKNLDFDAIFASYLIRFKVDVNIAYPQYIGHILQSKNWYEYIDAIAGGSAQPGANAKELAIYDILLPPLPEQKAIAGVLSSLDDKIDLLHRQNKTLEAMAETLFRQWFVEEEFDNTISQLITVQNGFAFKSKDFGNGGENRIIKIKNISDGVIDIINTDCVNDHIVNNIQNYFKIESGDVLIAMTGAEIGKLGIIPRNEESLWLNQRVGMLKEKYRGSKYLAYLQLKSEFGQDHINSTATGSAQPNISSTGIENCGFPKFNESEMKEYSYKLKVFFEKIVFNLGHIKKLEKLRDTLLPKLMSGEIRLNLD